MEKLINNFLRGVIVWAILAGIHGFTLIMGREAAKASQRGPMNYRNYTKMLIQDKGSSHEK